MGPAPRADDRVDLVDDHHARRPQHLAAALGGEQQVERLGRRDQNVRRRTQHRRALGLRRVSRPHGRRDARRGQAGLFRKLTDAAARLAEVLDDVGAQRLERRYVDDPDLIRQWAAKSFLKQVVERSEECGERLAGSGWRRDERMAAAADFSPAATLGRRRLAERLGEPARDDGMEFERGTDSFYFESIFDRVIG